MVLGKIKFQFKLILLVNFILASLLCALTPLIFGISYLDSFGSSFVLERFVSLVGVILIPSIPKPEQDNNIGELVESKVKSYLEIIMIRLILGIILMAFNIFLMIIIMEINHCNLNFIKFFIGTFITALFLGTIGLLVSSLSNNVIMGYLASLGTYILNFVLGSKLKWTYIFSLSINDFIPKYYLLGISIILIGFIFFKLSLKRIYL